MANLVQIGTRTELGFKRTICGCTLCVTNCRFIPGFLIPADLERLMPDEHPHEWAETNLLASPGALVMKDGQTYRIPTLVPKTKPDGTCINLTDTGKCAIHEVSPFGCAFFDHTMSKAEGDRLLHPALREIALAWSHTSLYSVTWTYLNSKGLVQKHSTELRAKMAHYLERKGW